MTYVTSFCSEMFDLTNEIDNSINPIKGISVGEWLNPLLEGKDIKVSTIDEEDWGWYSYAILNDQKYLIGYIANPENDQGNRAEIIIQIHKERTIIEKLLGKNKLTDDDPLVKTVSGIIKSTREFEDITESITG